MEARLNLVRCVHFIDFTYSLLSSSSCSRDKLNLLNFPIYLLNKKLENLSIFVQNFINESDYLLSR